MFLQEPAMSEIETLKSKTLYSKDRDSKFTLKVKSIGLNWFLKPF